MHSPALSQTGQSSGWLSRIPSRVCICASRGLLAVGDDDRAVLGRRLAAGHDFGLHGHCAVGLGIADFDQTHATAGDDGERFMPAVMRDEHAAFFGGLDEVELLVADVNLACR